MCFKMDAKGVTPGVLHQHQFRHTGNLKDEVSHTNTGANQDGDLDVEDIFGWCSIRPINSDSRERGGAARVELDKVSASAHVALLVLL